MADGQVSGTTNLVMPGADTTGQFVIVLAPTYNKVESGKQIDRSVPIGFAFGLVDLQQSLDAIIALSDSQTGMAMGLVDAGAGNCLIASFPLGHQHESLDCFDAHFLKGQSIMISGPVFMGKRLWRC